MKQICVFLLFLPFFGFSQQQFEVFFDFNAAVPTQVSLTKLNQWIKENKWAEITKVLGYCDSVDDSQYKKDLAMRRINSVLALLKNDSITISDNVELKPFGKDFKYSKKQEENRKVTFFYTLKLKEKAVVATEEKEIFFSNASELVTKEKSELADKFKKAKKGDLIRINNINFYFGFCDDFRLITVIRMKIKTVII